MSVLTFKSDEFRTFPPVLREYASYLNVIKGNSEKTVCEYLLDLRTFFRFLRMRRCGVELSGQELEQLSISELSLEEVQGVRAQDIVDFLMYVGYERANSTTTRMRKLSSLRSFYHYAHAKKHLVESDPTADIDAHKKGRTLPKYMTVEEAVRLLETVRSDTTSPTVTRDFCIIALFLNTGMRLSELVGLNLQSFDQDLTAVTVRGKGNKERIVYLNDMARGALRAHLRERLDPRYVRTEDPALFLSRLEKRISAKTVQFIVYKYLRLAGFGDRGLSVHKLRHTAATLMYQSGRVDIRVLKDVLGHEQLNTTQIYTHVVSRNMEEAMEQNPLADVVIKPKKD